MDPWEGDLKDPQSLNRYSYVRNNPLKYTDPTGKNWFDTLVDGYNWMKEKVADVKDYISDLVSSDGTDEVIGASTSINNTTDYSNFESGIIDESGNPKQYDFSAVTDVDDIIAAGITAGIGGSLGGKIIGQWASFKVTNPLNKDQNYTNSSKHFNYTKHATEQMTRRNLSKKVVENVIKNGEKYHDTHTNNYVFWKSGIRAVTDKAVKNVVTVFKNTGGMKNTKRFIKLKK